jgi:hypothetical protein
MPSTARVQRRLVSTLNNLPKQDWSDAKAINKRLRSVSEKVSCYVHIQSLKQNELTSLSNQLTILNQRHNPAIFLYEINNILAEIELHLDGKRPGFNITESLKILLNGIIDTYIDTISGKELYFSPNNFEAVISDVLKQHGLKKYTKVVVRDLEKLGCDSRQRQAYIRELIQPDISPEKAREIIKSIVSHLPRSKDQKPIIIRVPSPSADQISPEERLAKVVSALEEILELFERCHEFGKEYNIISRLSGRILPLDFVSNDMGITELDRLKQALANSSHNKGAVANSVANLTRIYYDSIESLADHTAIIEDILKESSLYYAKGQIVVAAFNFFKSKRPEIYQNFLRKFILLSVDYGYFEGLITELVAMHAKSKQSNVRLMEANLGITVVESGHKVEFFDFISQDLITGRFTLHEVKAYRTFYLGLFLAQFLGITWSAGRKPFAQIYPLLRPERFTFPAGSPFPQAIKDTNVEVQVLSLFSLPESLRSYLGTQSLGELMHNLQTEEAASFYPPNSLEIPTTCAIQRALNLRLQQIEETRPDLLRDLSITFGTIPSLSAKIFEDY